MNAGLIDDSKLQQAISDLRADLIRDGGPQISTMRNYRFAILQYQPKEEFALRAEVCRLGTSLLSHGWVVLTIDLQKLMLDRIRREGEHFASRLIAMEKRLDRQRGLAMLSEKISHLIDGPNGIASECSRIIQQHALEHPDQVDRTVALIARAGALYPFYRSSALLRHLDGKTSNVPVVLFYPGTRQGLTGLSFMGILEPDNDYRPRIYPD